jgi:hypothetical protein
VRRYTHCGWIRRPTTAYHGQRFGAENPDLTLKPRVRENWVLAL